MKLSRKEKRQAFVLTSVQFTTLPAFLILSPWRANGLWLIPEICGVLLGLWAIWEMRKSHFSITPVPQEKAQFIQSGPYKRIRHPMYAAILLTLTPLLISHFSLVLFSLYIVLTVNLVFKMHFEETLFIRKFYDYRQYSEKTKYLIPFIY